MDISGLKTRLDALQDKHQGLDARSCALQNRARGANRQLNANEQSQIDGWATEMGDAQNQIADIQDEIAAALDRQAGAPQPRVVPPQPVSGQAIQAVAYGAPTGRRYAELFRNQAADPYAGKFSSLAEFALAVANGGRDQRLQFQNSGMSEQSGVSAGFLVPPQFVAGIIDGALAIEAVRPNATILPMASNELTTAAFNYLDGTNAARAGLRLAWGAEAGTLSEQVAIARKLVFRASKANILCRVSTELAEDGLAFDSQLRNAMTAALAAGLDLAFISGTGAGQPLGIMNAPALITVAKETSQAANTLLLQNLAGMLGRLTPASYRNATWLVHPTVVPKLLAMTVVVQNVLGTENVGGSTASAVVQSSDGSFQIYGRPVIVTDAVGVLSAAGDVLLVDLTQYAIGMRRDVTVEMSRDIYFTTDELGFKLTVRLDGQPLASAATKLRDGTNTVSPYIALGAR